MGGYRVSLNAYAGHMEERTITSIDANCSVLVDSAFLYNYTAMGTHVHSWYIDMETTAASTTANIFEPTHDDHARVPSAIQITISNKGTQIGTVCLMLFLVSFVAAAWQKNLQKKRQSDPSIAKPAKANPHPTEGLPPTPKINLIHTLPFMAANDVGFQRVANEEDVEGMPEEGVEIEIR